LTTVECIWPAETILGETPSWCPEDKVVHWVDIDGKAIMRIDPQTGARQVFPQDYEFGCIAKRSDGGFIGGTNEGLAFIGSDLTAPEIFSSPEACHPTNRFNDGKCDSRGRFWVGSTDINEAEPIGALYRVTGSGDVTCMLPGVIVSNGLGWSPDDKTMYFTDSGHGIIYAFDFDIDAGEIHNKRMFAQVDEADGMPDGLTVDAEGFVWGAHWDGWRITRYDPDGRIDRIISLPVPNVTSVTFGGENLDQMFVTTARLGMTESQIKDAPLSGGLFVVDAGATGRPDTPYQG
jgi:sugar lactone lactonase YvrE